MSELKYWQAINASLTDAMHHDADVCVLGEDVAAAGGPFGATKGLLNTFGGARVRDTPISEAAIVGAAAGAAMTGLRPVVEIMFMDFMCLAMDQIVNQAAKFAYMSGGSYGVPLTVRAPVGAGKQTGPQHSQSFEAWLCGVPGLKVMWSHTPQDAYDVLRAAIADPDPVIVIENLRSWNKRGPVNRRDPAEPLAGTVTLRPGRDVSIVAWGACLDRVLEAAELLADAESAQVEILALRSLSPLDLGPVHESVARTGHLLVVQDAPGPCSVASEVLARTAMESWAHLRAPVQRLTTPFAPAPFSGELESAYFPSARRIADAVRDILRSSS